MRHYVVECFRDGEEALAQRPAPDVLLLDWLGREWLSTLLTSIGDAVIATGPDGHITFLNPEAERLTGWAQEDALGRPVSAVFRLLDARTRLPLQNLIEQVMCERTVTGLSHPKLLVRRDGTHVPIDDRAAPLCEGERLLGVVLLFRDISDRRRLEEEAEARADFEKHLVGIVSHDLRNPLQAILMSAATLARREGLDERAAKSVLRIQLSGASGARTGSRRW